MDAVARPRDALRAMRVTLLGTGTSTGVPSIACDCRVCTSEDPRDRRLRSSALLEWADGTTILVDAGSDCRQQLLAARTRRLDAILLTHAHADHSLGLDEVRIFNFRQKRAMPVFGNAETLRQVRRTFWYVFEKTQYEEGKPKLELIEVESGPFEAAGKRVEAIPIVHGSLGILAFRIGRFAYVTDALVVSDESVERLRDLDVLVINALREHPHPTHQSLGEALAVVERCRPRRAVLTHVGHWLSAADIDARSPEGVSSAHDGMTFELPEETP
jgi:phosphoribosyl 1,2-cyclic phosphate phosphodiesterase